MKPDNIGLEIELIKKQLLAYANYLTKDYHKAEDLYQEGLYRAICKQHLFDGECLVAWVKTIIRNIYINQFRKAKRLNVCNNFTEVTGCLHNNAVSDMAVEDINNYILALPKTQRLPMELRMQGYKYEEISEMLKISIGTTKSRIHFARKKITQKISGVNIVAM